MTIFYDSQTKKIKAWVIVVFVVVPVLFIFLFFFWGENQVKEKASHPGAQEPDIFSK